MFPLPRDSAPAGAITRQTEADSTRSFFRSPAVRLFPFSALLPPFSRGSSVSQAAGPVYQPLVAPKSDDGGSTPKPPVLHSSERRRINPFRAPGTLGRLAGRMGRMLGRIEPSKSPMFTAIGTFGTAGTLNFHPPGGRKMILIILIFLFLLISTR